MRAVPWICAALAFAACSKQDSEQTPAGPAGAPSADGGPTGDAAGNGPNANAERGDRADGASDPGQPDAQPDDEPGPGPGEGEGEVEAPGVVAGEGEGEGEGEGNLETPPANCALRAGPVRFETQDGVDLAADVYRAVDRGPNGRPPGAVLLHMIPPGNNRSNYSAEFIGALTDRGFDVVNVDRRGAGGSLGVARQAYEGSDGWLDAQAGYEELVAQGCGAGGADPDRVVIVGASNGTTTALDWTVRRSQVDGAGPAGVVLLTGGTYTENQHRISEVRGAIEQTPFLFVFSTAERRWSAAQAAAANPGEGEGEGETATPPWRFDELDPGGHGTRMFSVRPQAIGTVADWMAAQVAQGGAQ